MYKISPQKLASDVLHVSWSDGSPGEYTVTVSPASRSQSVSCDATKKPCAALFFELDLSGEEVVSVKKSSDSNTVAVTQVSGKVNKDFSSNKIAW